MKHLIVGGGIAGLSCAKRLAELDREAEITILSEEERPYSRIALPNILSGDLAIKDVLLDVPKGVKYLGQIKATRIFPEERKVVTNQKREFKFDKLLIASGAKAVIPDFEGNDSPFVFTIRSLSDILRIRECLKTACYGRVIISGAGLVSMEIGDALKKIGCEIVLLVSSDKILSKILADDASDFLKKRLTEKGIDIYVGEDIKRVKTKRREVIVSTNSGKEFRGDFLIVGKGVSPNIEPLKSSQIYVDKGIVVNQLLETNKKDIFSAGDICQGHDLLSQSKRINALWPVAIEQGRQVAINMMGGKTVYHGSMTRNIFNVFDNTIFTAGLSNSSNLTIYHRKERMQYSRIILRDGKLVGVIFINVKINPGSYYFAIEKGADVKHLKDVLLSGSLSYAHF